MTEKLEKAVRQRMVEYHQDLDVTCEKAIKHKCGVKVVWGPGLSYEMMASADVPFGEIHEVHPTEVSYEL